jgi:hypothetical protein
MIFDNSSNNSNSSSYYTDDYYNSVDYLFNSVGDTIVDDALYLFVVTTLSVAGFILNIVSLLTFNHKDIPDTPLYKYLRVYAFNGVLVNLIYITEFIPAAYRFMPIADTYEAQFYYNCILFPIVSTGYFYATILDILITLDRISHFNQRIYDMMILLSPYKTCAVSFIAVFIFNFPFYLVYTPAPLFNPKTNEQVGWYNGLTPFAQSQFGIIIVFIIYGLRDLFLLIVEIILNFVSVYFLKQHMAKKSRRANRNSMIVTAAYTQNRQVAIAEYSLQANQPRANSIRQATQENRKAERSLTYMALSLSILSVCDHVMFMLGNVFPYLSANKFAYPLISTLGDVCVTFKQACNFLIFFAFNRIFRTCFFKLLKRRFF